MYPYSATLFQPRGTVAPPAGRRAPRLPAADMVPDNWPAVAAMRGAAGLVPDGITRVIFGADAATRVAFDFPAADYRRVCGGPSCAGKAIGDFRGLSAAPAPARFY